MINITACNQKTNSWQWFFSLFCTFYAMELAFDAIRGHKSAHSFATGPVIADPESRTALVRRKITKYQVKALFNMCYTFQFDFRISFNKKTLSCCNFQLFNTSFKLISKQNYFDWWNTWKVEYTIILHQSFINIAKCIHTVDRESIIEKWMLKFTKYIGNLDDRSAIYHNTLGVSQCKHISIYGYTP